MHISTQKNDIEILDRLVELGADINAKVSIDFIYSIYINIVYFQCIHN